VIGNPIAGGGRARSCIGRLVALLDERGHDVEAFLTREAGEAGARAELVDDEIERLVVVGGDGTLNEVVNGLRDPSRVPLVQLPTGTANVLAHDLGLPCTPEGTADLVETGAVFRIDLGLAGRRRFLLMLSAGFDALVTREVRSRRTGRLGYLGYARPILRALRDYAPPRLRVSVDGAEPLPCGLVIASSTRNYGGLFSISRTAGPDSGHLDVCLLAAKSRRSLLEIGARALAGGIAEQSDVVHRVGRGVSISADEPVPVEIDGDYAGTTPITAQLLPRVVPVLVPRRSDAT
jgi:YegS/Rv2252/BmrU family lipid kinase